MTSTLWTTAPACFLRLGGCDVRPVADGFAGRSAAPVAPVQGTGVSVLGGPARGGDLIGGTVRDRGTALPIGTQKFTTLAHTYGTTLGIPSSRRPSS
jgi:hypothetical protein